MTPFTHMCFSTQIQRCFTLFQIRKKVSAKDDRASATTVGWAAVVWLGTMIGAIVLLDISSVVRDLKVLVNNLRQVF